MVLIFENGLILLKFINFGKIKHVLGDNLSAAEFVWFWGHKQITCMQEYEIEYKLSNYSETFM